MLGFTLQFTICYKTHANVIFMTMINRHRMNDKILPSQHLTGILCGYASFFSLWWKLTDQLTAWKRITAKSQPNAGS